MSNKPYDALRYKFVTAQFDWRVEDIRLAMWDGTPDFVASDTQLNQIIARGHVLRGYSDPITSRTVSVDGTVQTNNVLVRTPPAANEITWLTLCVNGASPADSLLVEFIDDAIGLPFITNGLDQLFTPDWATGKGWFRG